MAFQMLKQRTNECRVLTARTPDSVVDAFDSRGGATGLNKILHECVLAV